MLVRRTAAASGKRNLPLAFALFHRQVIIKKQRPTAVASLSNALIGEMQASGQSMELGNECGSQNLIELESVLGVLWFHVPSQGSPHARTALPAAGCSVSMSAALCTLALAAKTPAPGGCHSQPNNCLDRDMRSECGRRTERNVPHSTTSCQKQSCSDFLLINRGSTTI